MEIYVLESLFNKVAGLQDCNFIKKRLQYRCSPENIAKFLTTPTSTNICKQLLLQKELKGNTSLKWEARQLPGLPVISLNVCRLISSIMFQALITKNNFHLCFQNLQKIKLYKK